MSTRTLQNIRSLYILTLFIILICNGSFNLYKSSHPLRKTTSLFDRLKYHEIITFNHNQFHQIDTGSHPIYPTNGKLEFFAFNRHYKLLIRKNLELFSDSFHTATHRFNHTTQEWEKEIHSTEIPQCYYTAEVISDSESTSSSRSRGIFSACRGQGIRGWIHAFGETIVIRPKLFLTDVTYKGTHNIDDEHIIYKYTDLDRSDYPHNSGEPTCGHDHPETEKFLDQEIEKWKDIDPSKVEWIHHQRDVIKNHLHDHHHHDHEKDEEHSSEYDEDIIADPFSKHAEEIGENIRNNLAANSQNRRRLQTSTTRYVELAIVNDPGMIAEFDWGSTIGSIQIVLSAIFYIENFADAPGLEPSLSCSGSANTASLYQSSPGVNYCEVQYASYLSNFQSYRVSNLKDYDNAQLFSYYDFYQSVIGYASLPGMCISSSSGGIEQCTYDDEYNGNIVAHEMGHNFNMQHDSNGNTCDNSAFIMAAVGSPYGTRPDSFSTCSIQYNQNFFNSVSYQNTLKCLDNKPSESSFAVCRNGFVEEGEGCDCGQADCSSTDPCCDGSTCALYASADCSNLDDCCEDCKFKAAGTVCRDQDATNSCDIAAETCSGASSECPPDFREIEGTVCDDGSSLADSEGYCYAGSCVSIQQQCDLYGSITSTSYSLGDTSCSGYDPKWQVGQNECDNRIKCKSQTTGDCPGITGEFPDDGIPCQIASDPNSPAQCSGNNCRFSNTLYTYKWTVNAWQPCNKDCKTNDDDSAGNQTRIVECTLQNGTAVDDSNCPETDDNPRPIAQRACNDYVCDFCAIQPDGNTVCGEFGSCEAQLATCDCDPGYAGQFCDQPPALNFTGITSMAFHQYATGKTLSYRANPCYANPAESVKPANDTATMTQTIPVNVSSLTELLIGATVGVRWSSAGDIELLAVGLIQVDAEGVLMDESEWPFYVGSSLAVDKTTCDSANSTSYDPCLQKLECNDFTFKIPDDITPGYYRLLVRFNNVFNIQSSVLTISCNEDNCNSRGHGQCKADGTGCECDAGWSGDSCSYSPCDIWTFAVCDKDANGNCGSLGKTDEKPKCFASGCNAIIDTNNTESGTNQCDLSIPENIAAIAEKTTGCNDTHYEGQYCEIPVDFCSKFELENSCNDGSLNNNQCSWDTTSGKCLYSMCSQFTNKNECEEGDPALNQTSTYFIRNNSWSEFCEWVNDTTNQYCNRITCGGGQLPECQNGAVRRPIFDQFTDSPISICRAWMCDCTTVDDVQSSYWTVATASTILQSVSDSYDYTSPPNGDPLTASYINSGAIDLFTCSSCSLSCEHSSNVDDKCQNCDDGCPVEKLPFRSGLECNQVFWIAHFRVNIQWQMAQLDQRTQFETLIVQDLAYFLSTDIKHVSIWQVKPDGSGSIVYFRYLFDTDDEDQTQITGGDVMAAAKKAIANPNSPAVRGFIMQYTDSSYAFDFCVPTREECDPAKSIDMLEIFYICAGGSFGVVLIAVMVYRIITRGKRQRAYEEKVREVRQAQLRLMEHHSKARRVGMRDVSKNRASKIHKAHKKKTKEEKAEIKRRAEAEKRLNKINEKVASSYKEPPASLASADNPWGPKPVYAASAGGYVQHKQNDSQLELEQYRRYSQQPVQRPEYAASASGMGQRRGSYQPPGYQQQQSRQAAHSVAVTKTRKDAHSVATRSSRTNSRGSSRHSDNLPPQWKVYYNDDGIPYYYNMTTGQTTWRHPNE